MNKNIKAVAINRKERSRLIELGIDPEPMRALVAVNNIPHPVGGEDIVKRTRGGLVDTQTTISESGWVEEGSIILNSTINSLIADGSFIKNSEVDVSREVSGVTMDNSQVTGSGVLMDAELVNTRVIDSSVSDSEIKDSTLTSSVVLGSRVNDSLVNQATVQKAEITNGSAIDDTYVRESTVSGATLSDSHIIKSDVVNCTLDKSVVRNTEGAISMDGENLYHDPKLPITPVDKKFLDRGWFIDKDGDGLKFTKDKTSIHIREEGVGVSVGQDNKSKLIPFDMLDLVSEKAQELANTATLELSDADLEDLVDDGLKL